MITQIKTKELLHFLNSVYLNSLIEECVLDTEKFTINSVDMSNSIFIQSKLLDCDLESDQPYIGIGNLGLLVKYLNKVSSDEINLTVKENRLILKPEGTRAKFKYLLSDPEVIPNAMYKSKKDLRRNFEKNVSATKTINNKLKSEILLYTSLIDTNSITFSVRNKKLSISGGEKTEHNFNIFVGKMKGKIDDCNILFYKNHIELVLSILDEPEFLIGDDSPLIIKENDDKFYALVPLVK